MFSSHSHNTNPELSSYSIQHFSFLLTCSPLRIAIHNLLRAGYSLWLLDSVLKVKEFRIALTSRLEKCTRQDRVYDPTICGRKKLLKKSRATRPTLILKTAPFTHSLGLRSMSIASVSGCRSTLRCRPTRTDDVPLWSSVLTTTLPELLVFERRVKKVKTVHKTNGTKEEIKNAFNTLFFTFRLMERWFH